jgi:hypothetical protein
MYLTLEYLYCRWGKKAGVYFVEYWKQVSNDGLNCLMAEDGDWIPTRNHRPWKVERDEGDEIRNSEEAKEKDFWALWDAVQMDYIIKFLTVGVGSLRAPRVM